MKALIANLTTTTLQRFATLHRQNIRLHRLHRHSSFSNSRNMYKFVQMRKTVSIDK